MAPRVLAHPGTRPTEKGTDAVDNTSLAHPTRTIFVDQHLCEEIAELTGIEYRVLSRAFVGEEKDLTLDVVKTAIAENPSGTSVVQKIAFAQELQSLPKNYERLQASRSIPRPTQSRTTDTTRRRCWTPPI
jgi:hypothetical protein